MMTFLRSHWRRIMGLVLFLGITAAWMVYQYRTWESLQLLGVYPFPQLEARTERRYLPTLLLYLTMLSPVLWGYYLTGQLPRVLPERFRKSRWYAAGCAAVLAAVTGFSLLTLPDVQRLLPDGIRSVLREQGMTPERLYPYQVGVSAVCLGLIVLTVYIPGTIRCMCRLLRKREAVRAVGRYGLAVAIQLLTTCCYGLMLCILCRFDRSAARYVSDTIGGESVALTGILSSVVMPPLAEETAFRGLICRTGSRYMPGWASVLLSAVLFGLWHRNLGQFLGTVPTGIVYAVMYRRTGRLRYPMLCHGLGNLLFLLLYAPKHSLLPRIPALLWVGRHYQELPLAAVALLLAAVIAVLVLLLGRVLPALCDNS